MLIFLHMPKTGGTTINNLLCSTLVPWIHVGGPETLQDFLDLVPTTRDELKFATGHMPYGLHELTDAPCKYCVFLRDPVDRVVSAYYYCKQTPEHPAFVRIRDGMTLIEYARTDANRYARQLAKYEILDAVKNPSCYWWMHSLSDKKRLVQEAKATLDSCDFIGFYDDFDRDILRLFCFLHLPEPSKIPHARISLERPRIEDLPPSVADEIRALNAPDIELYNYARTLFRPSANDMVV